MGRYNTFAGGGRIYWSPTTGAFEVYGAIKDKYLISGGPVGALGFPVSGETDTPGGGRFNQFQNGFIVWHASGPFAGAIPVGNSAQLQLFSYQDTNHDSFNVQINITDSNGQVNHGRMPASDNYQNGNQQFNPPATLMSGEKGSDGRILCATFDLLNYEPHTLGDAIFALLTGLLIVIFSSNGKTQQITDEAGRTYYSYTTPPPQVRTINRDRRTRIPGMTFVPAYNTAAPAAVTDSVPFELYCITRPAAGFKWPSGRLAIAASAKRALTILPQWLNQNVVGPRLIFEVKTDRQSPYHWNLIAPRMSIDISSTTATDAVDVVTISDPGDSAQKVTLLTDKKAAARNFNFAVGGWRGNWRRATKVYSLSNVALEPGTSFSAGVSDGGKELWVHNPGKTTKFDLELYVGAQPQAILKKPNVTLDAGKVFRIRPSDWKAETMGNATIGMVVFNPANGQLLKSQTL